MIPDDSAGAGDPGGLSRRGAIGAVAAVATFVVVPLPASAETSVAFPVAVRISWRTGEAHDGGASTVAAVTAAIATFSGTGRAIWVHRHA